MSQALYRKYRSRSLDEVLGQDHVTSILRRALEKGKIAHAYLLTGPRGVGKTSVARILAHEINGLPYDEDMTHLDIIEIDAASNNGVDDIRSLREKAQVAPVSAAKKIYIIDEVHMLSKPAFNALLKTLEEPPAHIVFILATTDVDKLPATILSRVQQFYFRPISVEVMTRQLMNIAEQEGFKIDEAAARMIAEHSRGGFRDAISLLDQLSALASDAEPITEKQVATNLGLVEGDAIVGLLAAHAAGDSAEVLNRFGQLEQQGASPVVVAGQLLNDLRAQLHENPALIQLIRELIEVTKHPHPDLKLLTIFMQQTPVNIPPTTPATAKVAEVKKPKKAKPSQATAVKDLDWSSILAEAKKLSVGTYTLLAKSGYDFADDTLTIYAGSAFAQKKLDDAKNRPIVAQAVSQATGADLPIVINPGKKPPSNKQLAKIADIMGGGEEVNLEDMQ